MRRTKTSWLSTVAKLGFTRTRRPSSSSGHRRRLGGYSRRLGAEALEDRCMLAVTLDLAGTQSLIGGTNINASNESSSAQSEMTLDVNPVNPLNLAGFSHNVADLSQIDLFYSDDGGETWTTTTIDDGTYGVDDGFGTADLRFDPSIGFDADGSLYVAYGHRYQSTDRLIVARSDDGGATFSQFTAADTLTLANSVTRFLDKWQLATGLDPDSGNQAVYVAYTRTVTEPSSDY